MNVASRNRTYLAVVFTIFALMTLAFTLGRQPVAHSEKPAIAFTTLYQAALPSTVVKRGKELHGSTAGISMPTASFFWNQSALTPSSRTSAGSESLEVPDGNVYASRQEAAVP